MNEPARLHPNSWSSLEVWVLDISPNGFRAHCDARITVGSSIALEVAGIGVVHAHVSWCRDKRFGAKFDQPLDLARCAWAPLCDQGILSRMLIDRVSLREGGAFGAELELRRKILEGLPVRPVRGAEPSPQSRVEPEQQRAGQ